MKTPSFPVSRMGSQTQALQSLLSSDVAASWPCCEMRHVTAERGQGAVSKPADGQVDPTSCAVKSLELP